MKRLLFSALCLLVTVCLALPVYPAQAHPAEPAASGPVVERNLIAVPLIADPNSTGLGVPARLFPGGLAPQSSTFSIDYIPAGSTNAFGYTCLAWPAGSQAAFTAAANVWGTLLTSAVPIRIEACWADLGSTSILGGSATLWTVHDDPPLPQASTRYPVALANALAGSDYVPPATCTSLGYPTTQCDDMSIVYNSGFAPNFFYGTGGSTPSGKYDFMSIVLHEIGHGLGFAGSMCVSGGLGDWGGAGAGGTCAHGTYPYSYDRFAYGSGGVSLLDTGTYPRNSATLKTALTSSVSFRGENAKAAYAGANVPLYAPIAWDQGSSYAHLAETFNTYNSGASALMTYSIGTAEWFHDPGPVGMGVLKDVGWAPFAPTALTANPVSATQITLGWTDTNLNESGYKIERSPDGSSGWSLIYTTAANATSYNNTGLAGNTPYYYRVRAFHAVGESLNATANATTPAAALNTPSGLLATPVLPTQIALTWTDTNSGPNETGYLVERSANGTSGWAALTTTAADATGYNNTGLAEGTRYYYRVTAVGSPANSAPAGPVNAYSLLNTPTGLTATGASPTQINLAWTDTSAAETGYKVERSATGSAPWTNLTPSPLAANTQAYNDTTVAAENTHFYYRVTALNAATSSAAAGPADAYSMLLAPTGVAGTAVSGSQVNLTWNDASAAETGYRVERSAAGGGAPWTDLTPALLAAGSVSFSDTSAPAEITVYAYRVTAVNAATAALSLAGLSNQVTTLLNTPTNLSTASVPGTSSILIQWTDASAAETGYEIQTAANPAGPWTAGTPALPTNQGGTTSYLWTPAAGNGIYYFRVRAVGSRDSAWSTPSAAVLSNIWLYLPVTKK